MNSFARGKCFSRAEVCSSNDNLLFPMSAVGCVWILHSAFRHQRPCYEPKVRSLLRKAEGLFRCRKKIGLSSRNLLFKPWMRVTNQGTFRCGLMNAWKLSISLKASSTSIAQTSTILSVDRHMPVVSVSRKILLLRLALPVFSKSIRNWPSLYSSIICNSWFLFFS